MIRKPTPLARQSGTPNVHPGSLCVLASLGVFALKTIRVLSAIRGFDCVRKTAIATTQFPAATKQRKGASQYASSPSPSLGCLFTSTNHPIEGGISGIPINYDIQHNSHQINMLRENQPRAKKSKP
jgi:hypothetical protein